MIPVSFYIQGGISEVHGKELTARGHHHEREAARRRWAAAIFPSSIERSFLCEQQKLTDRKRARAARNCPERKEHVNRDVSSSHIHWRKPLGPPDPTPTTMSRPRTGDCKGGLYPRLIPTHGHLNTQNPPPAKHQQPLVCGNGGSPWPPVGGTVRGEGCSPQLWALRESLLSPHQLLVGHRRYPRPVSFKMFEL